MGFTGYLGQTVNELNYELDVILAGRATSHLDRPPFRTHRALFSV